MVTTSSPLTPGFTYDERTGRYRDRTGRFVPSQTIHAALQQTIQSATQTAAQLADQLRTGQISIAQWQIGMAEQIKNIHLASAALAKGGWAQLTPADFGRVGREVRDQYAYLRNLSQQIADGTQPLDGRFRERCKLYVDSSRQTYQRVREREMERMGFDQERNVLSDADHCDGCLSETARGWVGIGELVPIGSRTCLVRCRCEIEYRRAQDAA